nr:outer envelope pore protein 21B, chloroplastic-like [Tanacetum cinerariifolium]
METSLRYGGSSSTLKVNPNKKAPPTVRYLGDTSALKIHAKQIFRIDPDTNLQNLHPLLFDEQNHQEAPDETF